MDGPCSSIYIEQAGIETYIYIYTYATPSSLICSRSTHIAEKVQQYGRHTHRPTTGYRKAQKNTWRETSPQTENPGI